MNNDELEKMKVLELLSDGVLATYQATQKIYELQETLSKWLLGGAIAIIFAIFNNPKEFFDFYNVYFVKGVIILLLVSIYCGFQYILSHQYDKSLKSSDSFKKILEEKAKKESKIPQHSEVDINDPKSLGKAFGDKTEELAMNLT